MNPLFALGPTIPIVPGFVDPEQPKLLRIPFTQYCSPSYIRMTRMPPSSTVDKAGYEKLSGGSDNARWILSHPWTIACLLFTKHYPPLYIRMSLLQPCPWANRKLYRLQATLSCLWGALSCLRAASTFGLRRPSGRIMLPSGRTMWPSGGIIPIVPRARL